MRRVKTPPPAVKFLQLDEGIVLIIKKDEKRCRLVLSWGWRRSQGLGCSPIKKIRELGSDRRETGRSLSTAGVRVLRGFGLSTRGPG